MVKRVASAALWFISVGAAFEYITLMTGLNPTVGLVVAAAVAAFFGLDPLRMIWTKRAEAAKPQRRTSATIGQPIQSQG